MSIISDMQKDEAEAYEQAHGWKDELDREDRAREKGDAGSPAHREYVNDSMRKRYRGEQPNAE